MCRKKKNSSSRKIIVDSRGNVEIFFGEIEHISSSLENSKMMYQFNILDENKIFIYYPKNNDVVDFLKAGVNVVIRVVREEEHYLVTSIKPCE